MIFARKAFGLEKAVVATMQAVSGAGYPGPPLEVIADNVLPYIQSEEEKVESEPKKLLGIFAGDHIRFLRVVLSAHCHRVHVSDGHLEAVSFALTGKPTIAEVVDVLEAFRGLPQQVGLPFAPDNPIVVRAEPDRPQPKLDRDTQKGMAITVGRVRPCPLFGYRMVVLSHNTVRGAAGAAILNAELLVHQELL